MPVPGRRVPGHSDEFCTGGAAQRFACFKAYVGSLALMAWDVDALLWMARSGGRWRDPPERFGDHQAVKRR
jgi:hypothetical protein